MHVAAHLPTEGALCFRYVPQGQGPCQGAAAPGWLCCSRSCDKRTLSPPGALRPTAPAFSGLPWGVELPAGGHSPGLCLRPSAPVGPPSVPREVTILLKAGAVTAARLPAFADGACPFPALPVHRAQRWAGSWAWSPCSEGAVGFRWEGFVGLRVGLVPGFHCSGLSPCFLCRWGTSIGWPEEACALSSLCMAPRLGSGPHPSPQ